MPTASHRDRGAGAPWLERVVLSSPVGEWSTLRLVLSLLWVAVMAGLSTSFVYDDLVLNHRGEAVSALVTRTNYDQRTPTFNAELQSRFPGVRVLVENIHQHPHTGDLVALLVDPRKPTRVRDPESWHWHPFEIAPIALAPTAVLVAWAHLSRALRERRRRT